MPSHRNQPGDRTSSVLFVQHIVRSTSDTPNKTDFYLINGFIECSARFFDSNTSYSFIKEGNRCMKVFSECVAVMSFMLVGFAWSSVLLVSCSNYFSPPPFNFMFMSGVSSNTGTWCEETARWIAIPVVVRKLKNHFKGNRELGWWGRLLKTDIIRLIAVTTDLYATWLQSQTYDICTL